MDNNRIEILLTQKCNHWLFFFFFSAKDRSPLSAPGQNVSIENKVDYCDCGFIVVIADADKIV